MGELGGENLFERGAAVCPEGADLAGEVGQGGEAFGVGTQHRRAQMQRTVAVVSQEGKAIDYGLGLHPMEAPGQGTFWGHGGTVWGGGALAMTSADGKRQMSVAVNLQRWNRLDSAGRPQPHPIDDAFAALYRVAMYG